MIEAGLTQSRRGAKVGIESDPAGLRVFVPSCESIFYDHDSARSGDIGDDQETWLQTTVTGPGTLTFDYKLSCDAGDEYAFSIDGQYRSGRAGSKDWTESGPWTITGAGVHTIRWKFIKDSSGSSGSDCLWIDRIRWTGAMPDGEGWDRIEYAYDAAGRRIEKKVDGATQVKYVYDGGHILAEYNNAGTLLRKYVHGPGVDQPICLIESSGTYAGTHYYHYDALGSVVAMTNSAGNVVQLYEYSVYGQVAASDADHPNRFMFTGREFDKDTGLYYYRARYYHPEIGRFLQTDPIGYGDGMNWYAYCGNNSTNGSDPSGLDYYSFLDLNDSRVAKDAGGNALLTFARWSDDGELLWSMGFTSLELWKDYASAMEGMEGETKWARMIAGDGNGDIVWSIMAIIYLTDGPAVSPAATRRETSTAISGFRYMIQTIAEAGVKWAPDDPIWGMCYSPWEADGVKRIRWTYDWSDTPMWTSEDTYNGATRDWWTAPNLTGLAHELGHAYDDAVWRWSASGSSGFTEERRKRTEMAAMKWENQSRYSFYCRVPGYEWVGPRPAYGRTDHCLSRRHVDVVWGTGASPWDIPLDW